MRLKTDIENKGEKLARKSIESGNVPVEYFLGIFYCKGLDCEKNDEKSLKYFKLMFKEKKEDKDNRKKYFEKYNKLLDSFDCFMKDAQNNNNNKYAQYRIGLYYYLDSRDNKTALEWFLKSANKVI